MPKFIKVTAYVPVDNDFSETIINTSRIEIITTPTKEAIKFELNLSVNSQIYLHSYDERGEDFVRYDIKETLFEIENLLWALGEGLIPENKGAA